MPKDPKKLFEIEDKDRTVLEKTFSIKVDSEIKEKAPLKLEGVDDNLRIEKDEYKGNKNDLNFNSEPSKFIEVDERKSMMNVALKPHVKELKKTFEKSKKRERKRNRKKRKQEEEYFYPNQSMHSFQRIIDVKKVALIIAVIIGSMFVYKHREQLLLKINTVSGAVSSSIENIVNKIFLSTDSKTDTFVANIEEITTEPKDSNAVENPKASWANIECYKLDLDLNEQNISQLSFARKMVLAECNYLSGNLHNSYKILHNNKSKLKGEALLFYTILLLKRKEFTEVNEFLRGKCSISPKNSNGFFACLAKSLYQLEHIGKSSVALQVDYKRFNNPYASIYWLTKFLQAKHSSLKSDFARKAIVLASFSKRPVALSYIYETVGRQVFFKGDEEIKKVAQEARDKLSSQHDYSFWWVKFLASLKSRKKSANQLSYFISNYSVFVRLFSNLDFLHILGISSMKANQGFGLYIIIAKAIKYHRTKYKSMTGALKYLDMWKIRISISENRYRDAARILKSYQRLHQQDYFYHFYHGLVLIKYIKRQSAYDSAYRHFSQSLALRDSWEANYALAIVVMRRKNKEKYDNILAKLNSKTKTDWQKRWVFFLASEHKIYNGKSSEAIVDLLKYIEKNIYSFRAYELLITAYTRTADLQKASATRRILDRLLKNVPYYKTQEGVSSPMGAFALL